MFERKTFDNIWDGRMEPFRIIGNVYFAGIFQASTHIIDTGAGLILIDPGYLDGLYLLIDSIYRLGFKPEQIKYIVGTHWHSDHVAATASLAAISGAKTLIGRKDFEKAKLFFEADITISDGDTLTLGNTTLQFMETPGHTEGTVSFFFDTVENGKTYRVGMFGGAGANTLRKGAFDYPSCREDYRSSIERLKKEKVDIFIGNHVWNNDTENKAKILRETGENKFIDDKIWREFLDFCKNRLNEILLMSKEESL